MDISYTRNDTAAATQRGDHLNQHPTRHVTIILPAMIVLLLGLYVQIKTSRS